MDPERFKGFDAFQSEFRAYKKEAKDDLVHLRDGILTEVRERLNRQDQESLSFRTETKETLKEIRDLALSTNGRVNKHDEDLYGRDGNGGFKRDITALGSWRTAMVSAGGVVAFFGWILWMVYGTAIATVVHAAVK